MSEMNKKEELIRWVEMAAIWKRSAEAAERQRDALLALVEERVGITEPLTDCDCMDCTTLRKAREIVKSYE